MVYVKAASLVGRLEIDDTSLQVLGSDLGGCIMELADILISGQAGVDKVALQVLGSDLGVVVLWDLQR